MHVMFINPGFPAQFGQMANHLATEVGWPCSFVTAAPVEHLNLPFTCINYKVSGHAMLRAEYNPGNLRMLFEHMEAIYQRLQACPHIQPDVVIGHMCYGTMLYLKNLYQCPFVGYYDWLPPPFWSSEMALRPEFPPPEGVRLLHAACHTFKYLHLHTVDAAYTPTHYQLSTAPAELRHKIRVIFDGMNTGYFQRQHQSRPTSFRGRLIGPNTRVVTFASRGLESVRGFDIFMQVAKRIAQEFDDVLFLVAGDDKTHYGHEKYHTGAQSFKQYVLSRDRFDLDRFLFVGMVPISELVTLFSLSDLHIYLTAPFVLSWSLIEAMSCECTILASATAPVQEAIEHGVHGLLADFYDVETLSRLAVKVLRAPDAYRHLGTAARARVLERYELRHCARQLVELCESVAPNRSVTQEPQRPHIQNVC